MQKIIDCIVALLYLPIKNWGVILISIIFGILAVIIFFAYDYNKYNKTGVSIWHRINGIENKKRNKRK